MFCYCNSNVIKMPLTETQIKILEGIQSNLRRGDISQISKKTGSSRDYVKRVLSLEGDEFDEDIIEETIKLLSERQKAQKLLLKQITAISGDNDNTPTPIMQALTEK